MSLNPTQVNKRLSLLSIGSWWDLDSLSLLQRLSLPKSQLVPSPAVLVNRCYIGAIHQRVLVIREL